MNCSVCEWCQLGSFPLHDVLVFNDPWNLKKVLRSIQLATLTETVTVTFSFGGGAQNKSGKVAVNLETALPYASLKESDRVHPTRAVAKLTQTRSSTNVFGWKRVSSSTLNCFWCNSWSLALKFCWVSSKASKNVRAVGWVQVFKWFQNLCSLASAL